MMDINEIRELLPHRYPFLLVDRVVEMDLEEKRIRAYKIGRASCRERV